MYSCGGGEGERETHPGFKLQYERSGGALATRLQIIFWGILFTLASRQERAGFVRKTVRKRERGLSVSVHTRAPEEPVSWARLRALTMATLFPFRSIVSRLVVLQPSGVKSLWGREVGGGGEEVSGQPPRFLGTRTGDCGANRANLLLGDVLQHHVNVQIEALEGTHELSLVFQDHLVAEFFRCCCE